MYVGLQVWQVPKNGIGISIHLHVAKIKSFSIAVLLSFDKFEFMTYLPFFLALDKT